MKTHTDPKSPIRKDMKTYKNGIINSNPEESPKIDKTKVHSM